MDASTPRISVVVPSHNRAKRLEVLLDALASQSADLASWEVIVVHDSTDATDQLLAHHRLTTRGTLRYRRLPPDTGSPSRQRNIGWRMARAPLVAFTDDDCRPESDWLRELLALSGESERVIQGTTRPDPREQELLYARFTRTLTVDPPDSNAQTCNIVYTREALDSLEGFDERLPAPAGEDTDLAARADAIGYRLVAAPRAVVYHAIEQYTFRGMLQLSWSKWRHLPYVTKAHPHLRRQGVIDQYFWRESHKLLALALVGLAGLPYSRLAGTLVAPYLRFQLTRHGTRPRALLLAVVRLPEATLIDTVEFAGLIAGSFRYRTIFL